jgi:integrase
LIAGATMPHVKLFVWLALLTGARTGAILELTWDRVDFDAGTIDYKADEPPNPLQKAARKQRAKVTLTPELRFVLLEAKAGALTDHVIEWDGAAVKKIRKGFEAACRRAGLTNVTPHTLRHTHATMALESGVDLLRVSKQLGHRDSRVTEGIYSHTGPEFSAPASQAVALRIVGGKT